MKNKFFFVLFASICFMQIPSKAEENRAKEPVSGSINLKAYGQGGWAICARPGEKYMDSNDPKYMILCCLPLFGNDVENFTSVAATLCPSGTSLRNRLGGSTLLGSSFNMACSDLSSYGCELCLLSYSDGSSLSNRNCPTNIPVK